MNQGAAHVGRPAVLNSLENHVAKKQEVPAFTVDSLAAKARQALNEGATSTEAYQLGEHREHTWGVTIPALAFQWVIGGSNVLPCQRWISVSGPAKSLKSTLGIEIGTWFVLDGGLFVDVDNESKSSATMFEAMTWWRTDDEQKKMLWFKESKSVEEWQNICTSTVGLARDVGYSRMPAKEGETEGRRIPTFLLVDSLTGKQSEAEQEAVEKEGHAAARGYPIRAAQITKYLETMQLNDTALSMGYVRHLKEKLDGNGAQETGGAAANFKTSLSLRLQKKDGIGLASHPALPYPELTADGYQVWMESNMSCLGPDKRKIRVEVVWQYVPQEDGSSRQLMKYDWEGALGWLLWAQKYDEKFKVYVQDLDRLDKILHFVQVGSKKINCKQLGLEEASLTEFGRAIETNEVMRAKISNYLNITKYTSVHDVDLKSAKPVKKAA